MKKKKKLLKILIKLKNFNKIKKIFFIKYILNLTFFPNSF